MNAVALCGSCSNVQADCFDSESGAKQVLKSGVSGGAWYRKAIQLHASDLGDDVHEDEEK